jgi:hypothetical protein
MKILASLVAGTLALAVGAWFVMASSTERVIAGWLDARAAEGWGVQYAALDTGGFPTRFETVFQDLSLADPSTGWAWTAERFTLTQGAFRPDQLGAVWPDTQSLASPQERLTITSEEIRSDLDVQPTRRFALDASHTVMRAVELTSNLGGSARLEQGELQVTRLPEQEAQYDVRFEAETLVPPEDLARLLDPAGLLPEAIELARYEARMRFDRPWDLGALEDERPQITEIALTEMRAQWGQLLFRASGDLTVDAEGRVSGALAVRAQNWREFLEIGTRVGALSPGLRGAVENALGFVAGLSGRPEDIDATLRLDEGFVFFGPIPVGEAPRVILR